MKKITFILFALIAGTTFAQTNSDAANADAEIVSVITIEKTADLNFGRIISSTAGKVSIDESGNRTTDTAILGPNGTTPSAASFNINAQEGYMYSITQPATSILNGSVSGTMVATFAYNLPAANNMANDTNTLIVSGDLAVGLDQVPGAYTGSVTVTVAYE